MVCHPERRGRHGARVALARRKVIAPPFRAGGRQVIKCPGHGSLILWAMNNEKARQQAIEKGARLPGDTAGINAEKKRWRSIASASKQVQFSDGLDAED